MCSITPAVLRYYSLEYHNSYVMHFCGYKTVMAETQFTINFMLSHCQGFSFLPFYLLVVFFRLLSGKNYSTILNHSKESNSL